MSLKSLLTRQKANNIKLISRDIRATGKLSEQFVRETVSEVDPSEAEAGAVKHAMHGGKETVKKATKIARRLYAESKAKRRISSSEDSGMQTGSAYRRGEYISPNGLSGLSYGDSDAKREYRQTTDTTHMRRTRQKAVYSRTETWRRRTVAGAQNASARSAAAKQAAETAGAAAKKGFAAIGKSFAGELKWLLPFSLPAVAIAMVVIILMGALISVISPLGFFFSDNKADNTYLAANIVSRVSQSWYDILTAERKQYEDAGYIVNVEYNAGMGDGVERVNNWKDTLALYIVRNTDMDKNMIQMNDSDEAGIKSLFFDMNPINISTRVGQVEKDGKKEDVQYADISVSNLRYVQMLNKYPLDSYKTDMIKFLMSPDMSSTWTELGIDFDGGSTSNQDINAIIHDLPAGSLGSLIVQAAFTRLCDPYSMDLRGQGNYVDCSYLTQWAYAQVGISIPSTAAEQAQYCVNTGKVISENALQPGDLIFWSYPNNPRVAGRFMSIGHTAIYVGKEMIIEAAPSAGCVTCRAMSVQGEPILSARPYSLL